MSLMKLRSGFLCLAVLTFWNTSGGSLKQIFKSQTFKSACHLRKKCVIWLIESAPKMLFISSEQFSPFSRYLSFCNECLVMQEKELGSKFVTPQTGLKTIFRLELANKKPLFTKSANLVTARKFSIQPQSTTQGKSSLLIHQKS